MGISLQTYRCRIGCFNSSFKDHPSKAQTTPGRGPRKRIFMFALFLLSLSCTTTVFQAYKTEFLHTSSPGTFSQPTTNKYRSQEPNQCQTFCQIREPMSWPPSCTVQSHIFSSKLDLAHCRPPPSTWATSWQSAPSNQHGDFPVASRWRGSQCIGAWGVDPPTAGNPLFLCNKPLYIY